MNLFVVLRSGDLDRHAAARGALLSVSCEYPGLSNEVISFHPSPGLLIARIPEATRTMERTYVHQQRREAVLFSGLPVDPKGRWCAADATVLLREWDQICDLEGQFWALRVFSDGRAECVADLAGFETAYFGRNEHDWCFSNNPRVVATVLDKADVDMVGLTTALCFSWTPRTYTFRRGVSAMPGGEYWTLFPGNSTPSRRSYSSVLDMAATRSVPRPWSDVRDECVSLLRSADRYHGRLRCALTGGRDTRLIAALMLYGGIDADYYTIDHGTNDDVPLAQKIASRATLRHAVEPDDDALIEREWRDLARRLVCQNDGLATLWQITSAAEQTTAYMPHTVEVAGIHGELTRRSPREPAANASVADVTSFAVHTFLAAGRHVMQREAVAMAEECLREMADTIVSHSVKSHSFIHVVSLLRRFGNYVSRTSVRATPLCPLAGRAVMLQAFAVAAQADADASDWGYTALLEACAPWMRAVPTCRWAGTPYQARWWHCVRAELERTCLNSQASLIWDLVSRRRFTALARGAVPADPRQLRLCFDVLTIAEWLDTSQRRLVVS